MSLRPSNPKKITLDDLLPGDVLLSGGSDWLDELIMYIDQGDYSHTTQYIGKIKGEHMVVEATTKGIVYQNTDPDMTQDIVDAYRYVSPDGHHFGDPGWPVKPVLDKAKTFVGANYAYSELLMGAVVIMASEVPKEAYLSEIIRITLSYVEHQFEKWLNENADKTPMTCVQVATTAHWQADATPANKYGLQVTINGARKPPIPSKDMSKYQDLRSSLISKFNAVHPGFANQIIQSAGMTVYAGSGLLPLGSCTPRDMETSPTLEFVGCIKDTRK